MVSNMTELLRDLEVGPTLQGSMMELQVLIPSTINSFWVCIYAFIFVVVKFDKYTTVF